MTHKITLAMIFARLFLSVVFAEVPRIMNYQAKLTDASGVAINDTCTITFLLYASESGADTLWYQTQTVNVVNGLFDVQLNLSINGGDTLKFDRSYWIALKVRDDPEMTPREKLAPVSFAFRSIYADTADYADTAGYAETSSSSGGGNLNVYKSDGTTKLGTYLGCFYDDCGFHCGWAYALSTGGVHRVWSGDYRSAFGHTRLYYSGSDCTGSIYVSGGYKWGTNSSCQSYTFATDSTVYACAQGAYTSSRSYSSYRDYGGSCVNSSGSAYLIGVHKVCEEPDCNFACGDGPCIIKP